MAGTTDLFTLWDAVREDVSRQLDSVLQRSYMQQIRLQAIVEDNALLSVPDQFVGDMVESLLRPLIVDALTRRLGRAIDVAVTLRAPDEESQSVAAGDFSGMIHGDQRLDNNLTVERDNNLTVGREDNLSVGGDANTSVRGSSHLDAGEVIIRATHRIALEVGEHRLRLDESGLTIELGGGSLTITGAERVDLSGDVITAQGGTLTLAASGVAAFTGSPLKLN